MGFLKLLQQYEMPVHNNLLVTGLSGTGKTGMFLRPNIAELNNNYIVLSDTKTRIYDEMKYLLKNNGYHVFLIELYNTDSFNYVLNEMKKLKNNDKFCLFITYFSNQFNISLLKDFFDYLTKKVSIMSNPVYFFIDDVVDKAEMLKIISNNIEILNEKHIFIVLMLQSLM